jgi:hypothetical protein
MVEGRRAYRNGGNTFTLKMTINSSLLKHRAGFSLTDKKIGFLLD